MSFILDALKKSESDRQRQASPALFEVKVAAPRRKFPLWAAALGLLLGVNILGLLWVMLRHPETPVPAPAQAPVAAAPMAAAQPAAGQPTMVTVPATVTLPTTVNIPISSAPSITVAQAAPQAGVVGPSSTPPLAEDPTLESHEQSVPPDYDARDYRPALTAEQAGAIAAERRRGALPSRDEAIAQGTQLPDLRLDLHVYATNPADRFVFINMRKLKEGDILPDGVRVEQITPTGATLSYHGQHFTLDGQ